MKKVAITILILLIIIPLISSAHVVTPDSFSVNESDNFIYQIIIENTDQNASITQVNITLPSNFTFMANTQTTDSSYETFTKMGSILSWSNFSGYLINASESKYFQFEANATTGNYDIVITTFNTTNILEANISVTVLYLEEVCTPSWNCGFWSNCTSNFTQIRTCSDSNDCNNDTDKPSETRYCPIDSETECILNWTCTEWSDCFDKTQIRSCVDKNVCGNDSTKPHETKSCIGECTPNWDCTGWQPETCPKNKTQTQICTDLNNCNTFTEKPEEIKLCTYIEKYNIPFIILVTIIILLIIGDIAFLIKNSIKKEQDVNPQKPKKNIQNKFDTH